MNDNADDDQYDINLSMGDDMSATVTLTDPLDDLTVDSISLDGILYGGTSDGTVTINTSSSPLWNTNFNYSDYVVTGTDVEPTFTIGKVTINEQQLEKIEAMLDIMETDPEFSEKLQSQIAFNRLKK